MDSSLDQYQISNSFVSLGGPDSIHGTCRPSSRLPLLHSLPSPVHCCAGSGTLTSSSVGGGLGLIGSNGGGTNGVGSNSNSNDRLVGGSGGPSPFETAMTQIISWTMLVNRGLLALQWKKVGYEEDANGELDTSKELYSIINPNRFITEISNE